jgi:hypothetical protein
MALTSGDTVIRYKTNSCVNHPDREGAELCVHCGKYFCEECMSSTHRYLCKSCAVEVAKREGDLEGKNRQNSVQKRRALTPLVFAGLAGLALLLARRGIGIIAFPALFFLWVTSLRSPSRNKNAGSQGFFDFFHKADPKRAKKFKQKVKGELLTEEQVNTLLRLSAGRVSASKLAKATGTTREAAKKFLDKMTVNGKLNVEAGTDELIYVKI